ncbi:hypothetical protein AS156_25090 [Bradyrhizobium macuxiense]|uniref:Uncharacterized protein n=1 Tax=Bradyrhizobium macuxiense TaxID=1755647 RepID=A0A109J760_9BRAD|nr:hypothetical protein [Bradyrhizobium macuxiense]KWV43590.1 hypothetical protein AS156_25090 [Bradyrhizobium macuxiense]
MTKRNDRSSGRAGAFAQGAGLEVKGAKLGLIALTDAPPLLACSYLKCRQRVLEFLYERHRFVEAA